MPMVEAAAVEEVASKQTKQCGNYSASEDPVISASILTSHDDDNDDDDDDDGEVMVSSHPHCVATSWPAQSTAECCCVVVVVAVCAPTPPPPARSADASIRAVPVAAAGRRLPGTRHSRPTLPWL